LACNRDIFTLLSSSSSGSSGSSGADGDQIEMFKNENPWEQQLQTTIKVTMKA
jgi:hypothetical protein